MKKFVSLVMLLVLGSFASAATVDFTTANKNVLPNQVVPITIVADFTVKQLGVNIGETKVSAAADLTAGAVGTIHTGFTSIASPGLLCDGLTPAPARYLLIDRINGVVDTTQDPEIAAGQALYSFNVTVPAAAAVGDTFTIDDFTGNPVFHAGPPYGTVCAGAGGTVSLNNVGALTLTVIPEPATITLLGLGGLLLMRRRK
jgi:hypothetical protein